MGNKQTPSKRKKNQLLFQSTPTTPPKKHNLTSSKNNDFQQKSIETTPSKILKNSMNTLENQEKEDYNLKSFRDSFKRKKQNVKKTLKTSKTTNFF